MRLFLAAFLLCASCANADSLIDFGGSGNGAADNTSAFNAAVQAICASTTERTLKIPAGRYIFMSAPTPITCALNIAGEGQAVTVLIREYQVASGLSQGFIKWVGQGEMYGGAGGSIKNLSIDAGHYTGGIGLWIQAQYESNPTVGSKNPHGLTIENVFVIAGAFYPLQGNWAYGIYLDGTLNASPPSGVAPGIRFVRMLNVGASQFSILPIILDGAIGTRILSADCFVAVGTGMYQIYVVNDSNATWAYSSCPVVRG